MTKGTYAKKPTDCWGEEHCLDAVNLLAYAMWNIIIVGGDVHNTVRAQEVMTTYRYISHNIYYNVYLIRDIVDKLWIHKSFN